MNDLVDKLLEIATIISNGEIPEYQQNEFFTVGAYDLLLINADGPNAYELLQDLCNRFESINPNNAELSGYFMLLSIIAKQTNTTEMPKNMSMIIDACPELSQNLRDFYRYES